MAPVLPWRAVGDAGDRDGRPKPGTIDHAAASPAEECRVLIVEDDQILALALQAGVQDCGFAVTGIASTASEAIRLDDETRPHLVLMDVRLQGTTDGITAAEQIRASRDVPIIFQTAHGDRRTLDRIRALGAVALLLKPFSLEDLRRTILQMLGPAPAA